MEKLLKIQTELKAPKGQFNSFGKYKYRSCEDITEAVKPLLSKYKCTLLTTDELVLIGERYYIKATAKLYDAENNTLIEKTDGYAREEESKKGMDGSQITGASSSYARKYALNGLFAIDDNKDSDSTNKHDEKISDLDSIKKAEIILREFESKEELKIKMIPLREEFIKMDITKEDAEKLIKKRLGELK
jgi:hypothetical protein